MRRRLARAREWARHRRVILSFVVLTLVFSIVLGAIGYQVSENSKTRRALCVLTTNQKDIYFEEKARVERIEIYLEEHPDGFLDLTRADLQMSLMGAIRTRDRAYRNWRGLDDVLDC